MKKGLHYSTLFLSTLIITSCLEQVPPPPITDLAEHVSSPANISYATYGEFNAGELKDSIYSSSYFGFELPVIDGWDIILLNNTPYGSNTKQKALDSLAKDPSADNYFQLITLQMNGRVPLINFMVEKTEAIPNVSNASDYLAYTESYILEAHKTGFPQYIGHTVIESKVGERPFLNQTFSVDFETSSQFQRNYCVQFDAYIFTIITHYANQADLDVINELLAGISWKNKL